MRILTIGVLIVSGGTLAALPFRRHPAAPDVSEVPAQATGPTQSALDPKKLELIVEAPSTMPDPVLAIADGLPKWDPPTPPERRIDMPLTYDDLAIPVDQPAAVENRFNATASVQEKERERSKEAALVMPNMESIAIQQPASSQSLASVEATDDQATLVSAREASRDARSNESRERHWIRQPKK